MNKDYKINPFTKFDKDWGLVTAGSQNKFNSMTISWGGMGTLWGEEVVTIYIKPSRYTYNFLMTNDEFTVSFFKDKRIHSVMGTKSGRDVDKVASTGLHPLFTEDGITYQEAEETFYLKKIYVQQLNPNSLPEFSKKYYENPNDIHYMFIGKVIKHETK
jgi:flavin reductase (DIM6/NTAB) family NADH-FMN oxidoreductase RutF